MSWLPAGVLCLAVLVNSLNASNETLSRTRRDTGEKRVVCYYTNWSVYRPGTAKFNPQNINPYLCTHLVYAFGGLSKENALKPFDKYQDVEQGGYAKFNGLKTYNKELKTMLAIGGWNEGSARFSPLVADADRRKELVRNVIKFLRQNHFDGLDLDWEYPAFRDGGKARDRNNYATLVQELREEFDRENEKTGRPRLLLTMAVPAGIEYVDKGYDIPRLNENLDWFNILSYDYHSAFEPAVDHHAPLLSLEPDDEYNFGSQLNIDATVKHYLQAGADRNKLVLGIPTYGRSYTLFNPDATDIGSPADGPGDQGEATREKGYLAYYEICERVKNEGWTVVNPNPDAMGPFAYKGNQWVGYDDEAIARTKAKYVSDNDLGGIMFWSVDNDDFRGKCHGRPYPIIEAAKEALLASSNELTPSSQRTQSSSNSKKQSSETSSKQKNKKPRPKVKTTTTTRAPQATRTTPAYSTTTPQPPTTPDPGSDFVCKDEGFFPHPRDCKKYFWCLDSGPSSLGIVAHQFTCPSGLIFNKISDSCDYARNVICKTKTQTTTTSTTTSAATSTTARTTTVRGKFVITASPPRHTTTTTTTTEEPEYEEEEEEEQEDPGTIKELLGLIKRLGGVEQLEKQLAAQDVSGKETIKPSLVGKVLAIRTTGNRFRGAGEETSTARYQSLFRNRPSSPQSSQADEAKTSTKNQEKPQYVTIQRNRVTSRKPVEPDTEEDEDSGEEEDVEVEVSEAPKSNRRRPTGSNDKEYTQLRRNPNRNGDDSTTPKYKSIVRTRSTTESPASEEEDEDDNGETAQQEIVKDEQIEVVGKPKKYSAVYRERNKARYEDTEDQSEVVGREKVSAPTRPQYVTLNRRSSTPEPVNSVNIQTEASSVSTENVYIVNSPKYAEIQRRPIVTTTNENEILPSSTEVTSPSIVSTENSIRYATVSRQPIRISSADDPDVQATSTENNSPSSEESVAPLSNSQSAESSLNEEERSNFLQRRVDPPSVEQSRRRTRPPILTTQPYVETTVATTRSRFRVANIPATTESNILETSATRGRPQILRRARPTSTSTPPEIGSSDEPKRFRFAPRTKPNILTQAPKNDTIFTIVVPETTIPDWAATPTIETETKIEATTENKVITSGLPMTTFQRTRSTTTRSPPTTSTVTRVVTSITESSFTERQKITVTKKPTFAKRITKPTTTEKTSNPPEKKVEKTTRPYGSRRIIRTTTPTSTTDGTTERNRNSRFRPRPTTTFSPLEVSTEERKFVPRNGRARGVRTFGAVTEATSTTSLGTPKNEPSFRKRVLSRRIKKPVDDLDSQQSSSFYDEDDDELDSKYILGESIKKTSGKDFLSADVIFATVPPVDKEEKSAITQKSTTSRKPSQVFRGRIKAVESITEHIPEDYRRKIKKVIQRRRPVKGVNKLQEDSSVADRAEKRREEEVQGSSSLVDVEPTPTSTTTRPTTAVSIRRNSQDYLTGLRSRTRSTTTEVPATSTERSLQRRPGVQIDRRRKFRPDSQRSTTTARTDSLTDDTVSTTRSVHFSRRRTRPPITSTTTTTTTTTTTPEPVTSIEETADSDDLPDLADPAVAALHKLATLAPVPVRETPNLYQPIEFSPSGFASSSPSPFTASPRLPSTTYREPTTYSRFQTPRVSVATSYSDFRQDTGLQQVFTTKLFSPPTTARTINSEVVDTPSIRSEVVIAPRRTDVTTRRAPVQRKLKPFAKVPKKNVAQPVQKPEQFSNTDYEYYDDVDPLADVPASALKVKVHSDGYIECLDQGNFPHPFSCKKFISCAKMEGTELLGWEYTCPKHLSFDPVGGICNWSAGLGCQQ